MQLTDLQKKAIFKDLATVSKWQAAVRAGIDKHYKNKNSAVSAVTRIMNEVRNDPERFAISQDVIELVEEKLKERSIAKVPRIDDKLPDKPADTYDDMNIQQLVDHGAKKSFVLLNMRLDAIGKSHKALKGESAKSLATIAAILFDKRQIVQGEATEHVMMKAQISEDLTPSDKLSLILRMREINAQEATKDG